jgi:nitronate monooxygenase
MFGLDYPVMSAPMAMHSGATLAAAVSAAGALGSFGGVNPRGPDWVTEQAAAVRAATGQPFAVGFITAFLRSMGALFDAALAAKPSAIALSFGDVTPWIGPAKASGATVVCQVQTHADADAALAAGADVLVAQGIEAGGHTGTMSLLPFLAAVVDRHPDTPVLAAGGIGDGRTLAAVLAAGADGAWLGTVLLATPEAVEVQDVHKRLVVESDGTDTVFTRTYDILSGAPWPAAIGARLRRNRVTDEWNEREDELRDRREEVAKDHPGARMSGTPLDPDRDPVYYGQSAAFVHAIRPAAEVVHTICDDAEAILRTRPQALVR